MKELRVLSNLLLSIEHQLQLTSCRHSEKAEDSISVARLSIIQAARSLEDAYGWSITDKDIYEPNLPSVSGESMASKQPVHGEG